MGSDEGKPHLLQIRPFAINWAIVMGYNIFTPSVFLGRFPQEIFLANDLVKVV
jgi:hypothetical protein